jgi:hypothetical protein
MAQCHRTIIYLPGTSRLVALRRFGLICRYQHPSSFWVAEVLVLYSSLLPARVGCETP